MRGGCTANKKFTTIPMCHDQSWQSKRHTGPELVILRAMFDTHIHTHTYMSLSLLYTAGCCLTPRQPPHYIFTHFPQYEKAFPGSGPTPEHKTQLKGSIKQQVIYSLTGCRRAEERTNHKLDLWEMMEFQGNLNTIVPCKDFFWLPVLERD